MRNVVAAFAAAPLGGAGAVAAIALILALFSNAAVGDVIYGIVTLFVLMSIVGYVAAVLLGIPGYLVFRRLGWIRRAHWVLLCAFLGGVAGAVWPVLALLLGSFDGDPVISIGGFAVAGSLVGVTSGLVFAWIIKIEPPRSDEIAATFD